METIQLTGKNLCIELKGISVSYDDSGEGIIPIIFIHGFPFDKSSWEPQMEFLKTKHRVIAYDIRGFGQSTSDKDTVSIHLFAKDLIKFMDALEIKKAIVCGLSMGGYILLNAIKHYPKRFEAIILSDTQCIDDLMEIKEKRNKTISLILAGGLKEFTEGTLHLIFCPESLETKKGMVDKIRKTILSTSPETIISSLKALANRHDMCSTLKKIVIPTLIICGTEDKVTPMNQSVFMLQHTQYATLIRINKAGHLSNLEQPDEFNKHISNFISAIEKNRKNKD